MNNFQFKFDQEQFNRLFPFYFLVDENLQITSVGRSLAKICNIPSETSFNELFKLGRPEINVTCADDFKGLTNQLILVETRSTEKILLRGQFDYLESGHCYIFTGTPWFGSMEEVRYFGLTMEDFAPHDPMIDLLHVVKSQEIITEEGKKLLQTVNEQQEQLKESEEKYRSIVEKATHIIYKITANGFFSYVNRVAERITGYGREELLTMHYLKLIRNDHIARTYEFYLNQVQNKIPTTYFEFPIVTKAGEQVWIGQSVQCHKNKNHEIELTALAIDITQRKKAERNLAKQEEKYRNIIANMKLGLIEKDLQHNIVYVNQSFCDLTGYVPHEVIGKSLTDFLFDQSDAKAIRSQFEKREKGISDTYTARIKTKSGEPRWWMISGSPQYNDKGEMVGAVGIQLDITEQRRLDEERGKAEKNLAQQEERYRNIIVNMNIGLCELDLEQRIQYVNGSLCKNTGYRPEELIGKNVVDILFVNSDEATVSTQVNKRKTGLSDNYTIQITTKSGELRWWLISSGPRFNDKNEIVGSVGIQLDITEQRRLDEELKNAKEKAEASSKAKELFLATMSHEIRTPLNAIVGITDLMNLSPDARGKDQLDILSFSAKNLLALITDILDVSKIDAGKLEIAKNALDIEQVMHGIYQMFRPAFEEKKVKLILNIDDSVPKTVLGDELRLSQILNNLIGNALKFTHKGSVMISVKGDITEGNNIKLWFEIRDTGIGIKKGHIEKIFKAFEQADERISRQFGGTGLGLNITQKLVELQGGELRVKSKPNQGSIFHFYIDYGVLSAGEANNMAPVASDMKIYNGAKDKTILIVEDNLVNQKVAASYIHHWGLKCDVANNGAEALNMLSKTNYDIALIDLYMPVMDGFETIQRIRKNNSLKNIPVIALTASAEPNLMKKAITLGANRCLSKPFNAQELYSSIMDLSHVSKAKISVNKKTTMNKDNAQKFKIINLKKLEEASLGSKKFMLEMLDIISGQVPELIQEADNLWKQNNYDVFWRAIHKVKNNMLQIGMDSLGKDLSFIEKHSQRKTRLKEVAEAYGRIKTVWKQAEIEIEEAKIGFQQLQLAS